jgi:transposase InsO family protein
MFGRVASGRARAGCTRRDLDLFSRRVVGRALQTGSRASLPSTRWRSPCATVSHARDSCHSDRGSQYASGDYQAVLAAHGVVCSMSPRANCWDAVAESFFSTLKSVSRGPSG